MHEAIIMKVVASSNLIPNNADGQRNGRKALHVPLGPDQGEINSKARGIANF
jgi:hypothetical protein